MKGLRILCTVALVLTVLASFGVMTAAAQGPTPTQVAYLDSQTHTLGPGASQLLRFDYFLKDDGSRPLTTIRLPNGTRSGAGFEIWTADQLHALANNDADARANPTDNRPIGRGTAQSVNCDTGVLDGSGACLSPDLTWSGRFGSNGTYYVKVINNNNSEFTYQLNIQGTGVSLGQQQTASVAPSAPAAAPALVTTGSDPSNALKFDTQSHALGAGAATWYRFDYQIKDDASRPTMAIRLPNGKINGLAVEIWTADQLHAMANNATDARADPIENRPIGRGTAATVNCDTGAIDGSGACVSPDLTWTGTFGSSGPYFVKVINNNTAQMNYQLLMTEQ